MDATEPSLLERRRFNAESYLREDHHRGIFQCKRELFTDPALLDLEFKYIFEGNWVYLAHESQIAGQNDYYTTYMGRQPVVITRNRQGEVNAFINACSHRGAMLCRFKRGNRSTFTCPFHGWTFNNSGKLLKVKDPEGAGYSEYFNSGGSHDLKKLPHLQSYRGFIFGSLNPDVLPLEEHLGEARKFIDLVVDQAPNGIEVLQGSSTYTYDGNWKLQTENGADGYHVSAVHWNYVATIKRRKQDEQTVEVADAGSWAKHGGGYYSFENGHLLLWTQFSSAEFKPNFNQREKYLQSFGPVRTEWMLERSRNLCLYPNLYIMDQFATQIRVIRPLAVDKTEVTIYCFGHKGESAEARAARIRQYEDFFNVSGMGTPDDLEEFRSCQIGFMGAAFPWNDMSRGATHQLDGPDDSARELGIQPKSSGVKAEDEGLFPIQHRFWAESIEAGIRKGE